MIVTYVIIAIKWNSFQIILLKQNWSCEKIQKQFLNLSFVMKSCRNIGVLKI